MFCPLFEKDFGCRVKWLFAALALTASNVPQKEVVKQDDNDTKILLLILHYIYIDIT